MGAIPVKKTSNPAYSSLPFKDFFDTITIPPIEMKEQPDS
jgi:hypothetical protein